ncbi:hypothetical protein DUNSADRAFT_9704, partial [Dunaliella salina]
MLAPSGLAGISSGYGSRISKISSKPTSALPATSRPAATGATAGKKTAPSSASPPPAPQVKAWDAWDRYLSARKKPVSPGPAEQKNFKWVQDSDDDHDDGNDGNDEDDDEF